MKGTAERGTERRKRPPTSPGFADTSLSAASVCRSVGPAVSTSDLGEIADGASKIAVHGARYPEHLQQMVGR